MEPTGLAKVSRSTLADSVCDSIRSAVLNHQMEPGERLSIDRLAVELEVSQTPVREALSRLAADSLVEYEPLVGYRVTSPLGSREFDQLMEARFAIEPTLAGLAAERRPAPEIPELESYISLGGGDVDMDHYERYRQHTARDSSFHLAISWLAQNEFLAGALNGLNAHLHIYRLHHPESGIDSSDHEHRQIASAISEGDSEQAEQAMIAHLDASYHRHSAGLLAS